MSWTPILALAPDVLAGFAAPDEASGADLADGAAGRALLFDQLARAGVDGCRDEANTLIDRAIEAIAAETLSPSLFHGFTGIAWVAAHLGVDLDHGELDEVLVDALARPWPVYDLADGMTGVAVYALERLPDPGAAAVLAAVVDRLCEIAVAKPTGKAFWTVPAGEQGGGYTTGAAHGIAGVLPILAGACAWNVATDRARPLLDDAVAWLRVAVLPEGSAARYPIAYARGREATPSRSAWCDGDPGIAAALLAAARAVGEQAWESDAIAIAKLAARRPVDDAGVIDAGLCHGAAGLGHVLNRIYQATGDTDLRTAAVAWIERALASRVRDHGLVAGNAGLGLALAAALSTTEPAWDRCLACSLRLPT